MASQTEEGQGARETVPEAGTMACCYTWRRMKRMLGLVHTAPHFAAFGAWVSHPAGVHIQTWHKKLVMIPMAQEVCLGGEAWRLKARAPARPRLDLFLVCSELSLCCEVLRTLWHCGEGT